MNKKVLMGVAAGCAVGGCIAAAAKKNEGAARQAMWDKMRQRMEEMPADFPPRVMFDNIEAIKANTEQILNLVKNKATASGSATGEETERDDIEVISST